MANLGISAEKQLQIIFEEPEIWVPCFGYYGSYEINNYGVIRSLDRMVPRVNHGTPCFQTCKGRVIKQHISNCGYLRVSLSNSNRKMISIHRLMLFSFGIPNPDNKKQVNHKDGDKTNNALRNLEWATGSENINHAHDTGLKPTLHGEDVGTSKLKNVVILAITSDLMQNISRREIADKYKLPISEIGRIARGERWSYVTKIKPLPVKKEALYIKLTR